MHRYGANLGNPTAIGLTGKFTGKEQVASGSLRGSIVHVWIVITSLISSVRIDVSSMSYYNTTTGLCWTLSHLFPSLGHLIRVKTGMPTITLNCGANSAREVIRTIVGDIGKTQTPAIIRDMNPFVPEISIRIISMPWCWRTRVGEGE